MAHRVAAAVVVGVEVGKAVRVVETFRRNVSFLRHPTPSPLFSLPWGEGGRLGDRVRGSKRIALANI